MGKKLNFETTLDIEIPKDPFERIIGQEDAVRLARMIPIQRRHLLLVGPPGTGKSMIAQAISSVIKKPTQEISIVDNPEVAERPIVEVRSAEQIEKEKGENRTFGKEVTAFEIPTFVAERFNLRCRRCGGLSPFTEPICPHCGAAKNIKNNPFERLGLGATAQEPADGEKMRVATSRRHPDGKEEIIIYERTNEGKILMLTQQDLKKQEEANRKSRRKVIIPLTRTTFVQASGGTETELLGDIRHDPYGGHHHLGTPAYLRVVPGAVHEAHEGVLFIDELSTLGNIQRYIFTAMQDKQFSIVGRNPMSSGAAAKADSVPCDFIFVGACNINDMKNILPPLRSRIRGDGYEVLMNSFMEDTPENELKLAKFISQEIRKDGKIPHAKLEAVNEIIEEARSLAKKIDNVKGITLRLRNLSGIIKMSGDIAKTSEKELIEKKDVQMAIKEARPIEERLKERYGSWWASEAADYGVRSEKAGVETA